MSTENDDFIEKLLRDLPKAEPLSELETRRFEKFIDAKADEYKKSQRKFRFQIPTSIAASVAIAMGAVIFFSHNNTSIPTKVPATASPSAAPSGSSEGSETTAPTTEPTAEATAKPVESHASNGGSTSNQSGNTGQYTDLSLIHI